MSERIDLDMLKPDNDSRERVIASAMWQVNALATNPLRATTIALANLKRPAIMLAAASILAAILSGGAARASAETATPAASLEVPEQWIAWENGAAQPPGLLETLITSGRGPQ